MEFNFAYSIRQSVYAIDTEGKRYSGVVLRRWLEENPHYMNDNRGLLERYMVLLSVGNNFQQGEFLAQAILPRN